VTPQEVIHEAIQSSTEDSDLAGGLLTGWVLVCEWMNTDGALWMSRLTSDGLPTWRSDGMLEHTKSGSWPEEEE